MSRSAALVVATVLLIAGCSQDRPPQVATPSPAEAVERFDPDDLDASLDRLNRAAFSPPTSVTDLEPFLRDLDPDRRWAAVYLGAILVEGEHADLLRPVLEDPDEALRVMAAGALARLGVAESLPVLVDGLRSEAELPYVDPPRPASDLALEALRAYTDETFTSPAEWSRWWTEVGESLRWDGSHYVPS